MFILDNFTTMAKNNTYLRERIEALCNALLPENGRIELPKPFGLDQYFNFRAYDIDNIKYIRRMGEVFYLDDGEFCLPISCMMEHQKSYLCNILSKLVKHNVTYTPLVS